MTIEELIVALREAAERSPLGVGTVVAICLDGSGLEYQPVEGVSVEESNGGDGALLLLHNSACDAAARLEYLRGELRAERISYGEIAELQSLAAFIDPADVELREAIGLPDEEGEGGAA